MKLVTLIVALEALLLSGCGREQPAASGAPTNGESASTSSPFPGDVAGGVGPSPSADASINRGVPKEGAATIEAPGSVNAGGDIEVHWTGAGNAKDYVDLVSRGETKTNGEITYAYIESSKQQTVHLRAPTQPGDYDVRYVLDLNGARSVKAISPLLVNPVGARLSAPPNAMAGANVDVRWDGPNGEGDYVDLVAAGSKETSGEISYAYTSAGSPAVLRMPSRGGLYDIRYVGEGSGARAVFGRVPITITVPNATVSPPASTPRGLEIKLTWTGPANSGDYIDLVPANYAETTGELSYFYTRDGDEATLTAPDEPGEYEVRYVLDAVDGRVVLARSPVHVD